MTVPIPARVALAAGRGDAVDDERCGSGNSARRPSCPLPAPGASAGGCAYDGSAITLVPVADVAHLVHGPIGCLGNSWESRGSLSSGPTLHRRAFTTDLGEHDVIFGGEGRLREAILDIGRRFRPAAVFVYLTCVPGLIGDDVEAICREAAAELGLPVVPVLAAGFVGTKNAGNRLGGSALLTHVIGTAEPAHTTPFDVNLIGEYNIAGELWQVLPLLDRLGIRVLSRISGDARYAELTWAHRAKASMVVCSRALLSLAADLQAQYGVPWFEGSFYGVRATSEALRGFAEVLGDPSSQSGPRFSWPRRRPGWPGSRHTGSVSPACGRCSTPAGSRAGRWSRHCRTPASRWSPPARRRAPPMTSPDSRPARCGRPADRGRQPRDLLRIVRDSGATLLAAGGRNLYTAMKGRVPFLDVNQERHQAYAGYDGVVTLAAEIDRIVSSPVFDLVRQPAPWAADRLGSGRAATRVATADTADCRRTGRAGSRQHGGLRWPPSSRTANR